MKQSKRHKPTNEKLDRADRSPISAERSTIPLVEETLSVTKEWKQAGEVIVTRSVETRDESLPVDLMYEEVHVERVPVNRAMAEGENAAPRQEGDTLIIPIVEEELVVTKRRIVREEIRITKTRASRQETVNATLRSEQIRVENSGDIGYVPGEGAAPH